MKYRIELQEKYNGKIPRYISLNDEYDSIEEAKIASEEWKNNNPDSNFIPIILRT